MSPSTTLQINIVGFSTHYDLVTELSEGVASFTDEKGAEGHCGLPSVTSTTLEDLQRPATEMEGAAGAEAPVILW